MSPIFRLETERGAHCCLQLGGTLIEHDLAQTDGSQAWAQGNQNAEKHM